MNISISKKGDSIVINAVNLTESEASVVKASYFEEQGDSWLKIFSVDSLMFDHDFPEMEKNLKGFIQQEAGREFNKTAFENALEWVCETHKREGIYWWLPGSAALYVRGLDVEPHDIDLMVYKKDLRAIEECVKPYIVEPFHHVTDWMVKGFGVVNYNCRIDYSFEPETWVDDQGAVDFGPYAENNLETIAWKDFDIKVPSLHLHLPGNEARGRNSIVSQIQKKMGS